jgi:hypothetical protein
LVFLLCCVEPTYGAAAALARNAPVKLGFEAVQGGENTQANAPRISKIKLRPLGSHRNVLGSALIAAAFAWGLYPPIDDSASAAAWGRRALWAL